MIEKLKYVDFNNNVYRIKKDLIHYAPMRAKYSSSGIYSGGEEKTVRIDKNIFEEIVEKANNVIYNTDSLVNKRRMLTSMLFTLEDGDITRYIFTKSEEQAALLEMLNEAIK